MAQDLERLVVSMSADFKSFENAMAKVSGLTKAELRAIKAEAATAGGSAAVAFSGATRGVQAYGRAAQTAAKQSNSLEGQTGNLAAQFQDIAVQLQGGANPLTIALQQGTQISSVLGGQGAGGAVKALGAAFLSVVSPVSLLTIGLIAAGGAAVQYFANLSDEGVKTEEQLKKQADLIQRVADTWGEAVPSIKAYADELARAGQVADLTAAAQGRAADIAQGFKQEFVGLGDALFKALDTLNVGDLSLTPQVFELQDAFQDLTGKVEDGTAKSEDFDRTQAALASLIQSSGNPALQAFAANLGAVAGSASNAAAQIARVTSEAAAAVSQLQTFRAAEAQSMANYAAAVQATSDVVTEQERLNGLTREQLALENEIGRVKGDVARAGGIIPEEAARKLAADTLAAEERRAAAAKSASRAGGSGGGGGGGRSSAASEADREREAVAKLIETLQFESSLIGMTAVQREQANAIRRAGAAATAEERAQIEQIVAANYAQVEAVRANEDALDSLRDLSRDVLGGMIDDLREGASAGEAFAGVLSRIGESMLNAGIDSFLNGMFKPGATGVTGGAGGLFGGRIIPGILHDGGTAGRDGYGHNRSFAPGTWNGARRYHKGGVAGLAAGEIPAILQKGEVVIPKMRGGRGSGSSGGGSTAITIDVRGATGNEEVQRMVAAGVSQGMSQVRREVPGIVTKHQLQKSR